MHDVNVITQVVGSMLTRYAGDGKSVTYTTVAREIGLPPPAANWRQHPLRRAFEFLDAEDITRRRPLRTVMVINKKTGRPGKGFFRSLECARHVDIRTDSGRERAYRAELVAVRLWYGPAPQANGDVPLAAEQVPVSLLQLRPARSCSA